MSADSKQPSVFNQFADFMQRDSKGVEILTYGIACAGMLTAIYRIRPFSRFTRANQVPKHFFSNKTLLEGTVRNVEFDKVVYLLVDHKPLLSLSVFNSSKYLPVTIAGVNINSNGYSWLSTVVKGQKVNFLPVSVDNRFLSCIITMREANKEPVHIGQELVDIGFATVEKLDSSSLINSDVKRYERALALAQRKSIRQRNGIWQQKHLSSYTWTLRNNVERYLKSVLPVNVAKYLNI